MEIIRATYTIVTPMFLGGADQTPADGIRPPSVKGVLRFWWRALQWGHFWKDKGKDENKALRALHKEEARLFGAAMGDKEHSGGQGCFLLSIQQPVSKKTCIDWPPDHDPNHGASYMAYGLLKTNEEAHRIALLEEQEFTVQLAFKPNTPNADYEQIKQALETWSLLGGLGGRSRRAMGAITLKKFNDSKVLCGDVAYETKLEQLFAAFSDVPPAPFTALSKESCYRIVDKGSDARELVRSVGFTYKMFRGQDGLRGKNKVPFGLPLQKVDMVNRRSSPLFFHIHQLLHNTMAATVIYLPASIFHPDDDYKSVSLHKVKAFVSGGINT